jgi:anthranilate phosphoribosyltransferase
LKTDNIVFLYAKVFYPFFKYFASARKEYAKPTVFNILGPLLNPANTNYQMIGCSFEEKIPLIVETLKILGKKKAIVVRGED